MSKFKYCESINFYKRLKTRVVNIGDIPLGGNNPIRIQSMTTTDTMDTSDTVNQSIRMIKAGCEYVRITAPNVKQAQNLSKIKKELISRGYNIPLIADIHFTPKAAEIAAEIVSKVRINPGNYADRKRFQKFEINDNEYNIELNRIYDKFSPLVKICKENGTVMRIGTNHGSLSDRIMNRYGDTPLGMVESALEYIRICEDHNYFDIVLSMKSSNPIIMINAYRLLVNKMIENNMRYPLHLGVTEAGDGMEGRIKSSLGIGTLLEDGIGDTIRVSLTEEPEFEIPVAKNIIDRYNYRKSKKSTLEITDIPINPYVYTKRKSDNRYNIGNNSVPIVIADLSSIKKMDYNNLSDISYSYMKNNDKWVIGDLAPEYIYLDKIDIEINLPLQLKILCDYSNWIKNKDNNSIFPILDSNQYLKIDIVGIKFIYLSINDIINLNLIKKINADKNAIVILESSNRIQEQRNFFFNLLINELNVPVIITFNSEDNFDNKLINSTISIGAVLIDGFGDGIFLKNKNLDRIKKINELSFNLLQATRTRISKTEFISCPSCGRTQFDLQNITEMVRKKTSHLKGLKIAVMGCIVNGPGEMADADYGYVGTGRDKISLYKGHNLVKSHIDSSDSIKELINLIKINNDWIEPN
jgi:(E)-4-hydroxy-3-methylbut-2-enyl-diphosphate synthase